MTLPPPGTLERKDGAEDDFGLNLSDDVRAEGKVSERVCARARRYGNFAGHERRIGRLLCAVAGVEVPSGQNGSGQAEYGYTRVKVGARG